MPDRRERIGRSAHQPHPFNRRRMSALRENQFLRAEKTNPPNNNKSFKSSSDLAPAPLRRCPNNERELEESAR